MVFALLIAAILWNPNVVVRMSASSSAISMVGSIIGVGLASQLMQVHSSSSGLDWSQVFKVFEALLISPILGFALAGATILVSKWLLNYPSLYKAPKGKQPPPWPIRMLMVVTCTGVSFFHGSNDGQKGMGLIMLILIGTVPTAYALNHAVTPDQMQVFVTASTQAEHVLDSHIAPGVADADAHAKVANYLETRQLDPTTLAAVHQLVVELNGELGAYKNFSAVPAQDQTKIRNDMYMTAEALRLMDKAHNPSFTRASAALKSYRNQLDKSTRFYPGLGEGCGCTGVRTWNHGGLASHRDYGWRAHWQRAYDLCAGRDHGPGDDGNDLCCRQVWAAGEYNAYSQLGCGRHHGRERQRAALVDRARDCGMTLTLPAAALFGSLYFLFRLMA